MPISQNLFFTGEPPPGSPDEPPGRPLAESLASACEAVGWSVAEVDNWRDAGWSFRCERDTAEVDVALAQWGSNGWMLQIAPSKAPGLLGKLFGATASAAPDDLFDLAGTIHKSLNADGHYADLRWRWDGPPDRGASTPEPTREAP
jgi:hypothetical protein